MEKVKFLPGMRHFVEICGCNVMCIFDVGVGLFAKQMTLVIWACGSAQGENFVTLL